jgi:hypothetical protein
LFFRAASYQSKEAGIRTLVALDDQGGESTRSHPIIKYPNYTPTSARRLNQYTLITNVTIIKLIKDMRQHYYYYF